MFKKEVKKAKIVETNGKFFLEAGKESLDITSAVASQQQLKELVGQTVELIYSEPIQRIVALKPIKRKPITCYLPVDIFRRRPFLCYLPADITNMQQNDLFESMIPSITEIVKDARLDLMDLLKNEGFITEEAYRKFLRKPTCYIAPEEMFDRVTDRVRLSLAEKMLKEKIISKAIYEKITK